MVQVLAAEGAHALPADPMQPSSWIQHSSFLVAAWDVVEDGEVAAESVVAGLHHGEDSQAVQSVSISGLHSSAQSGQNEHSTLPG